MSAAPKVGEGGGRHIAPPSEDRILIELAAIKAMVAIVRDEVRALAARLPEPKTDPVRLELLLRAIRDVALGNDWTVRCLMDAALDSLPGARALRAAIVQIVGRDRKAMTQRLGRFLAAHVGIEAGGLALVCKARRGRDGAVYGIEGL